MVASELGFEVEVESELEVFDEDESLDVAGYHISSGVHHLTASGVLDSTHRQSCRCFCTCFQRQPWRLSRVPRYCKSH